MGGEWGCAERISRAGGRRRQAMVQNLRGKGRKLFGRGGDRPDNGERIWEGWRSDFWMVDEKNLANSELKMAGNG